MTDDFEKLVRGLSSSPAASCHTTAACRLPGKIESLRVGFGDIPIVRAVVYCRPRDYGLLVDVVRQIVYRTLEANGIPNAAAAYSPTIGEDGREQMFIDSNPLSPTHGKRKRGVRALFHFEIDRNYLDWFRGEDALRSIARTFKVPTGG